jgi:hypothetical protein
MMTTHRLFTSRYRAGVIFAPGPILYLAPMLIIPGFLLFRNPLVAIGFGLFGVAVGALIWTTMRQRNPPLVLGPEGMRIEGKPWSQIEGIRPVTDERGRPAIEVRLRRGAPLQPRSPLWRATGRHTIMLQVALLDDNAPDIEDAFEYFLTDRVS